MNIDKQRLQQFFNELKAKREAFAENYKYFAPQLAPQFNCFDFINSDENKLSEIIAHLLNPQATHAQGNLFLKLFFEEIKINYPNCNQQVNVNCEVVTHSIKNNQRRIDILVDFEKDCFGLAIENKPWATDQNEQLSDYADHLKNVYKDKYCLIYLSGNDSDPSPESISEEKRKELEASKQYKKMNFFNIVSWLKQCEKESKSDHVKHFLRDFIAYCQKTFLGETNMIDKDVIKKTILENNNNMGLAFEIAQQIPTIQKELLEKFRSDLKSEFTQTYPDWIFENNKDFYLITNKSIYFYKKDWNAYRLAIGRDPGGFYFGIYHKDGKINEKTPSEEIKKLGKLNTNHPQWWWFYFDTPYYYRYWGTSIEPWLGIQSKEKETVTFVMEKIKALIKESKKFIDDAEEEAKKAQNTPTEAEKQP